MAAVGFSFPKIDAQSSPIFEISGSTLVYATIYKGPETSSDVNTFTNVIKRHRLQQTTGTLQRYLRHKLLCTYFRPGGICRIRFIMFD